LLNTVLVDAGPLIALFDRDDKYHEAVKDFLSKGQYKFVSTAAVLTEVSSILNFNAGAQIDFFEWILKKGVALCDVERGCASRIIQLIQKYSDMPVDFTDATLVLAAEKTGIHSIISVDSNFAARLPGRENIHNIFYGKDYI
jgi:predicted nucleic acid-binding protein